MIELTVKEAESIVAVNILETTYGIYPLRYTAEKIDHIIKLLNDIKPSLKTLKDKAYENQVTNHEV